MAIFRCFIFCSFLSISPFIHASNIGQFVLLSDFHYNPMEANTYYPTVEQDPNKVLLDSVINHVAQEVIKQKFTPDFFLITGDFLAHVFPDVCAGNKKCIKNTISYPLQTIRAVQNGVFKNIPIYATLGNNDSYAGDYKLSSSDGFFQDIGNVFASYAFPSGAPSNFLSTFKSTYGSYVASIPATCKNGSATMCKKIMVLNTVPFSNQTALLTCDNVDCSRFRKNIVAYINRQINGDNMPAFVAMHIPNSMGLGWDMQAQPQISEKTNLFLQCSNEHKTCVKGVFAGHIHMFIRSIQTASTPKNVPTLVAPTITPMHGATPGYLIISYDRENGNLTQIQRFYIGNYGEKLAGKAITTPISWDHQVL